MTPLTVFIGTWNVNAKTLPAGESLSSWLFPSDSVYANPAGQPYADIYVVGFQEMVDLSAVNVAMDRESIKRSQFWQDKLADSLNSNASNSTGKYTVLFLSYLTICSNKLYPCSVSTQNTSWDC